MNIEKYVRKSFEVEAVQVTTENIEEVATWCNGQILGKEKRFIKVKTLNPITDKQTKAYVGDFVLVSGKGYKVYTKAAFKGAFEKKAS